MTNTTNETESQSAREPVERLRQAAAAASKSAQRSVGRKILRAAVKEAEVQDRLAGWMLAGLGAAVTLLASKEKLSAEGDALLGILVNLLAIAVSATTLVKWIHAELSVALNDEEILFDPFGGNQELNRSKPSEHQHATEISLAFAIQQVGTPAWLGRICTRVGRRLRDEFSSAVRSALLHSAVRGVIPKLVLVIWAAVLGAIVLFGVTTLTGHSVVPLDEKSPTRISRLLSDIAPSFV